MTESTPTPRKKVSVTVAADYAGLCEKTIRRWITEGQLPAYRFGARLIRVDLDDIDALLTPISVDAKH